MLEGERINLGPIKREYIEHYLKWFNDPEIIQYLLMYLPMTRVMEEEWFENLKNQNNDIYFAILIPKDTDAEKHIGNCGIHKINWKNRVGSAGIVIGEKEYQGKGYGTEAMELLLKYGFNTLNLNRIELEVYDFNIRAIKSYKKLDFIEEGRKRQAVWINGRYHDEIIMAILKEEWKDRSKK